MKSREDIINYLFENLSKKTLDSYKFILLKQSDQDFAFLVFHQLVLKRIYQCPLKDIESNNIVIHCNTVFHWIIENFSMIKPIFERKENDSFLESIQKGTEILYNALDNMEVLADRTLWECALNIASDHIDSVAVRSTLTFMQGGDLSYTSSKFMQSHGMKTVSNISEATNDNTLYAYLYDNHWYLLLLEGEICNVLDIRGKSNVQKKSFVKDHEEINVQISYINTCNIQSAIEKVIGIESICGKVCITINNYLPLKQGSITKNDFLMIGKLLKSDPEYWRDFIKEVISLIKEDSIKEYCITDEYVIYEENTPNSFPNIEHNEFIKELENDKDSFYNNWNSVKFMTLGLVTLTGLYIIYNKFFGSSSDSESDPIEQLLTGETIALYEEL